ncbi:MAG: hypothetical protein AB1394_12600 [Bacteroidota bacterium]
MESVFADLKKIMRKHQRKFEIMDDTNNVYSLNSKYSEKYKRKIWFGGVRIMKNYVSYHLMPVYMFPELLEEISAELKKHMHGKSCFNFKTHDKKLFRELSLLTEKCVKKFEQEKNF